MKHKSCLAALLLSVSMTMSPMTALASEHSIEYLGESKKLVTANDHFFSDFVRQCLQEHIK